jgi:hypothetical protein
VVVVQVTQALVIDGQILTRDSFLFRKFFFDLTLIECTLRLDYASELCLVLSQCTSFTQDVR